MLRSWLRSSWQLILSECYQNTFSYQKLFGSTEQMPMLGSSAGSSDCFGEAWRKNGEKDWQWGWEISPQALAVFLVFFSSSVWVTSGGACYRPIALSETLNKGFLLFMKKFCYATGRFYNSFQMVSPIWLHICVFFWIFSLLLTIPHTWVAPYDPGNLLPGTLFFS